LNLRTMYTSGISSSLPKEVQEEFVQSIPGLENAKILIHGYAVEYDVVDTTELNITLEHKEVKDLYFAGQVNGTSGYEEAAGQGLIAGINASLSLLGLDPLILSRHDSYIGVMIEDLTSNTRDEPYRLFTARSENRLYIREDNTLIRISPYRAQLCLNKKIDEYQRSFLEQYKVLVDFCDSQMIPENSPLLAKYSGETDQQRLNRRMSVSEILRQAWLNPITTLEGVLSYFGVILPYDLVRTVAISKKYDGYIKRSEGQYDKIKKLEGMR